MHLSIPAKKSNFVGLSYNFDPFFSPNGICFFPQLELGSPDQQVGGKDTFYDFLPLSVISLSASLFGSSPEARTEVWAVPRLFEASL